VGFLLRDPLRNLLMDLVYLLIIFGNIEAFYCLILYLGLITSFNGCTNENTHGDEDLVSW